MHLRFPAPGRGAAWRRLFVSASIGCLGAASVLGQADPGSGVLLGHVSDAAGKLNLSGALVSVAGTRLQASAGSNGDYRLDGVPAGKISVAFSYVGYANQTLEATVEAGRPTRLDAKLRSQVLRMDAYRVTSQVVGTARAINNQRAAPALTDEVASDAIGTLPDKNIAEALQRVPGVEAVRDKGEGRFINIRGLDQIYDGVSMNGIRMSTAEKGTREMELDVISSTFIAGVDVNKVNTPDMDSDDMGGSVNIRTRSGFDQDGTQMMVQMGSNYGHQEDRHGGYNMAVDYADQADDGAVGFALDAAMEYRPFTDFAEPATTWSQVTSPTDGQLHWILNSQDFRHYDAQRWRRGFATGLDFKLSPTEAAYVRIMDSSYLESNQQYLTTFPFSSGTVEALTDTTATVSLKAGNIIKSMAQIKNNKRESSSVAGLNSDLGQWTSNFEMGYTTGKYTRPTVTLAYANTGTEVVSYGFDGPYDNTVQQISGPSLDSPANYAFSTKSAYTDTQSSMHEDTVKEDLRYDVPDAPVPEFIKFGVEYRDKLNTYDTSAWKISSSPFTLGQIATTEDTNYGFGGFPNFQIRQDYVQDFYSEQSLFPTTLNAATTYGGAFNSSEAINAEYAMAGVTLGKLKLTAGGRLERTDFWMQGWQYDATTGAIKPVSGSHNYDTFMPGVIGEYEFTPDTLARFSWTRTLSRPDYSATSPGRSVNDSTETVSEGNMNLAPLIATNYDASVEHYYSPLGLVSAGVFTKSITNFTYQAQGGTDPTTGYLLTNYYNGPKAWIYGVELNWVQQLRFLPGALSGLGFLVNGVVGDSEATYPTRPGEKLPFTGFGHEFGNVALTYSYGPWNARVAENFHGRRLEANSTIGANAAQDQYEEPWKSVDASVSYSFLRHWQAYLLGSNLNNAPLEEYYGGTGSLRRIQTYEAYGWSAEGGMRWYY